MNRKKILILTANFGTGHNSVAKSIKKYLEDSSDNYDIHIKDFIDISIPILNKPMVKLYEYQTKYLPFLYNTYYYTKKYINSKYDKSHKIYLSKLKKYIIEENPDLIISTFPQASASVNDLKESSYIDIPLITVITDVVDSNEWIHKNTNMYFVPSNFIKSKLMRKNISQDKIKVTGIPVYKDFITNNKKIVSEKKNLLFMGGGRGLFDVNDLFFYWLDNFIENNKDKINVSVVTGTNFELYEKLTSKEPLKNIKVFGFIDNMSDMLNNHDILITKAGGVTLFESINSGIPVIVKKPAIGQEIYNAKFINKNNIGIVYSNEKDLKKIIKELVIDGDSKKLNFISNNINQFKKEINPIHIANYIHETFCKNKKEAF